VGSTIGHGQAAWLVKKQVRTQLIVKGKADVTGARSRWIAALDHEIRDSAMKNHAVVKRLAVHGLAGFWIFPVLFPGGKADEVGHSFRRLFGKQFTFEVTRGGVDDSSWIWGSGLGGRFGGPLFLCALGQCKAGTKH